MKKFFHRDKKVVDSYESYENDNIDWNDLDDTDDVNEDVEYYAEEAGAEEYYGAEEEAEAEEYYGEEEAGAEEYYGAEEEAEAEEYYGAEEETEAEEYYGAEEEAEAEEYYGAEEEAEAEAYYSEEEAGTEEYYAEEDEEDDGEEDDGEPLRSPAGGSIWKKAGYAFVHMSAMDKTVALTGILVLVLAIVTGVFLVSARSIDRQVSSFEGIGSQLDGIELIGQEGLAAIAGAELEKVVETDVAQEEEPETEYEETDFTKEVEVAINMTSIEKDLKLKFVNARTNKLIANVPFSVTVTKPDGSKETWKDDDMDGVIYKSGITPGEYTVTMDALTDSRYADYGIVASAKKVTVRSEISYQKVEVSDEIKDESEINATKEDTKENDTVVESTLSDTVGWVESTQTVIDAVYVAVSKTSVPDPLTTAKNTQFMRTTAIEQPTSSPDSPVQPTSSPDSTAQPTSSPDSTAQPTSSPDNTVQQPTASPENTPGTTQQPTTTTEPTASPSPTPAAESRTLTLSQTSLAATVGAQATITASIQNTVQGGSVAGTITAESGNKGVAEVAVKADGEGKATLTITPIAAGTAVITAGIEGTDIRQTCTVTVSSRTLTLSKTTLSVLSGSGAELTATVNSTGGEVKAESSNTGIATVSVTTAQADGKTTARVAVNGVSAGSATITVTHTVAGAEIRQTCTVTVVNKDNKLVDADKRQLYVLVSEGTYREATYADYYNASITTFYVISENVIKYTGWQTIDGKLYYYDASGKKITGEQVIQGAKYTFASDGSLVVGNGAFGIDVSKWNGTIDWNAVKNSGVSYVIIRCGYRGSSTGVLVEDPKFRTNIQGATAAGIKVGVYFFSQAVNKSEAVEEASMVLELIRGYTISYPVFLDVEASGGRADAIDKATRTDVIKAFCETIQNSGYTAGVYANKSWLTNKIDTSQLSRYKIWLAQYAAEPTYTGRYDLWQYKSTGKVSGINGNVDLNLSYLGY